MTEIQTSQVARVSCARLALTLVALCGVARAEPVVPPLVVRAAPVAAQDEGAPSHLRLPAILGDHMVLQRNADAPLWGWCAPGARVDVSASWSSQASLAHATADASGRWETTLRTSWDSGPHTLRVTCGDETVTVRDVLLGEVWLASGQSNMEMTLEQSGGAPGEPAGEELVASMHVDDLRLFLVRRDVAAAPRDDLVGAWRACTPETARGFSAVGVLFGRMLHEALGAPVGVVASSWGGTPVEAWTSPAGLAALGGFDDVLLDLARLAHDPEGARRRFDEQLAAWRVGFDAAGPGPAGRWMDAAFDDSSWPTMELPGRWEDKGLLADGIVWYRRFVTLPDAWRGEPLVLSLGPIDDRDVTFVDGVEVGSMLGGSAWETPRVYPVPAEATRDGALVIAVRVWDTGGDGGLRGEPSQLTLRRRDAPDPSLALDGAWRFHVGLGPAEIPAPPIQPQIGPNWPTTLNAAMIAPLQPLALAGVLWYQGEANVGRAFAYREALPALIADWRAGFRRPALPFLIVQIAPFAYGGTTTEPAELKEAQFLTHRRVPRTGLVVTTDIGNPADIHPKDKTTVARRLLAWALHDVYGRADVVPSGPLYRAARVDGTTMRITFDHVDGGLAPRDAPLSCFTLAGEDRVFHPAHAVVDGDEVVVDCADVPRPVAVRFAWGAADEPELRNGAGLPAAPFRSDAWKGATEP
ncbi:MAG: hypothetical protein H6825_09620 [Planctomycetes bacterium]|nr:hypothetical protein [Planctomycetota bacterium]